MSRGVRLAFVMLCAALLAALVVLALRPDIDLATAHAFFVGPNHFVGDTPAGVVARYTAWYLPFATFFALCLAGLARALHLIPARFAPSGNNLAFLALTVVLGPGLLVHATLKEISHRPRPYSVAGFGGQTAFRPLQNFDGACRHNCSFPSGETAAATWMVAPASLVPPPWTGPALVGAVTFAAATGALRMAFGAHFLSDVCAGALITLLVVAAGRALLVRRT